MIFLETHPKSVNISILFIVAIVSSFGLGVYVALSIQKQLIAAGGAAYIVGFFGSVGAIDVIYRAIQSWKKKKNAPNLSFDGVTMTQYMNDKSYSITLVLSQSSEEAGNCHAYISVEDYKDTIITGWSNTSLQHMKIGYTGELRLFTISSPPTRGNITFIPMPASVEQDPPPPKTLSYNKFIDKELIIKIVCETANPPTPYKKKISEIISEGDKNNTVT